MPPEIEKRLLVCFRCKVDAADESEVGERRHIAPVVQSFGVVPVDTFSDTRERYLRPLRIFDTEISERVGEALADFCPHEISSIEIEAFDHAVHRSEERRVGKASRA